MERHQHIGHASVPELESPPTQQLRQHGAKQTQRADAYTENHAALRRGAHVAMHPPWLQQDTAQLLQDTHTRVQTLPGEQLDPCKAPLKVPLLTCCEEEDEGGEDVGKDIKRQPLLLQTIILFLTAELLQKSCLVFLPSMAGGGQAM